MSTRPDKLSIPPLAGLASYEEAARVGLSVADTVARLKRYNYVETRLFEMSAAFLNPTPEWEVKSALSLHLYLDAEHSQALRKRVGELRQPPLHLDSVPDPKIEAFMEEALRAGDTLEFLTGVFCVVRPALARAYRKHLAATNPVFDFPTCRLLRIALAEEEQMIVWGKQALQAFWADAGAREASTDWEQHLNAFLDMAGGIDGTTPPTQSVSLPSSRARSAFVPDVEPRRDDRSGQIYNFHYRASDVFRDESAPMDERVLALMFKRFHEMDVPEMMASILLQTKGKPWEYSLDMARQLWDEARHSMMGEVWFAKYKVDWSRYPNHVGWSLRLNTDFTPLERHIVLYGIEQNLMDGERGKKQEWLVAQGAQDPLAAFFQDYDWADEVLHAQIGRKWLKPDVGDVRTLLAMASEISARPSETLKAQAKGTVQEDWWPRFVHDVLGRESASLAGVDRPASPTFQALASG